MPPSVAAIVLEGFLLGWSVAWPPGPINVEIVRRGTNRGFIAAWLVGCGAFCGDFFWALAMSSGASVLARNEMVKLVLAVLSTAFMIFFAVMLLKSWLRGAQPVTPTAPSARASNGFLLGLTLSVSSPWNAGFWFAIAGQSAEMGQGMYYALLLAGSVMLGAATWVLLLSASSSLGRKLFSAKWQHHSELAAAVLMFYFAIQSILRIAGLL